MLIYIVFPQNHGRLVRFMKLLLDRLFGFPTILTVHFSLSSAHRIPYEARSPDNGRSRHHVLHLGNGVHPRISSLHLQEP